MEVILNKAVIEYREHLLLFIDREFVGRDILFLETGRLPYYPYEGSYDTTEEILSVVKSFNDTYRGIYEFIKGTLDDPAVKLFLEVMEFE